MSHIFISYSRKDLDFAKRIVQALKENGLDVWIDWESIWKGEEWRPAINRGIEEADAFLFLISPDSVISEPCNEEITHALENNKLIIPIIVRDAERKTIREELSKLNWIFCRYELGKPEITIDNFQVAIDETRKAIHTDYEWLKYQARLQVKALEWERQKDNSRLLKGKDLQEAEQKLASVGRKKEPQPTDLQRQFVGESRTVEREEQRKLAEERRKTNRRLRILVVSLGGIAICAIIATSLATLFGGQVGLARRGEQQAIATATVAQGREKEQANIATSQNLASISSQIIQKNPQLAFLLSIEALRSKETPEAKRAILENINYSPLLTATINGHTSKITSLTFSNSGNLLAIGDTSGYITIHNIQSNSQHPMFAFNTGNEIVFLQFLEDDTQIISGTSDGNIQIWDIKTNSPVSTFKVKSDASYFVYMGIVGNNILVTEDSNANLQSIDLTSQKVFMQKDISAQRGSYILTTPELRDSILVLNEDEVTAGRFYQISPITGKETTPQNKIKTYVFLTGLAISHNQKLIATGGCNTGATSPCLLGSFDVWNTETGNQIFPTNTAHIDTITALAFSSDDKVLASASGGSTNLTEKISILLWSLDDSSGYPVGTQIGWPLYGHQAEIEKIIFSPNSKYVVSGDKNGTVLLWDLSNNSLYVKGNVINNIKISPDGFTILASGDSPLPYQTSAEVYINLKLAGEIIGYTGHACDNQIDLCGTWLNQKRISNDYPRLSISFLDEKTPIVGVNLENQTTNYNLMSGKDVVLPKDYPYLTLIQEGDTNGYLIVDVDPAKQSKINIPTSMSNNFSYTIFNNTIYIYDRESFIAFDLTGKEKGVIMVPGQVVDDSNIIPEKNLLLGTWRSSGHSVILWDLTNFSKITQLDEQWFPAYSPAKGLIATVDINSNFVNLWNTNGEKIASFPTKATPQFKKLIFSNDGSFLAGHQTTSISVWDIFALDLIGEFDIAGEIDTLAFSSDNSFLATGGCTHVRYHISDGCLNGKIQFYYLNTQDLINTACKLAGRNLAISEWTDYIGNQPYQSTCPQWN